MDLDRIIKNLYKRLVFTFIIFILIIGVYIFLLNFYSKRVISLAKEIYNLKKSISEKEENLRYQNQLKTINEIIKREYNKDLITITQESLNSINRPINEVALLIENYSKNNNWQIVKKELNENSLKYNLIINKSELNRFFEFLINTALIFKIKELSFTVQEENYLINIVFRYEKI